MRMDEKKLEGVDQFIHGVTVLLGIFPLCYGILTIVFGDPLWNGAPTYGTALSVPASPESWGVIAILAGLAILTGEYTKNHTVILAGCSVQSVWCMFFAIAFLVDSAQQQISFGLPGTLIYTVTGTLMITRARLAWAWRQ